MQSSLYASYRTVEENKTVVKTIPSYEIAEMMDRKHSEVLRMLEGSKEIIGIIPTLENAKVASQDYFIKSTYKVEGNNKSYKYYECTKIGCDLLASKIRGKNGVMFRIGINSKFCTTKETAVISIERKEILFFDALKESLKPFDIHGVNQYSVINKDGTRYRIDYYIPSLNIAIEYDENNHQNYTYEKHEGRQKEIEDILGCRFIRVNDNKSNEYNIGLVIKQIFNL